MADKDLKYRIDADDGPLGSALQRVGANLSQFDTKMDGLVTGMQSGFGRVTALITGMAAVLGTGAFAAGIKSAIDFQDKMDEGAERVGLTTEAYSEYAFAAKLSGLETEDFSKAVAKMSSTLLDAQQGQKQAADLFRRLKLDPQQVQSSEALLSELANRFSLMQDGAAKTALAIDIFGEKAGPKLVPLLNQGQAGIESLREEARKLGVSVSTEAGKAAAQLNDDMDRLHAATQGASLVIATELAPSLAKAVEFFTKAAKEAGVFQAVLISIGAVVAKGMRVDETSKLEDELKLAKEQAWQLGVAIKETQASLARDPGSDVYRTRLAGWQQQLDDVNKRALNLSVQLARLNAGGSDGGAGRGSINPPTVGRIRGEFVPEAKVPTPGPAPKAPESQMPQYLEELEALKLRYVQEHDLREMSKTEEVAYWNEVRSARDVTAKDQLAISTRVSRLQIEVAREANQQNKQLITDAANHARDMALAEVDFDQQQAELAVQLGAISQAQLLQMDQDFEQRRTEIRRQALLDRLAAVDPERDPVTYAQISQQIAALEMKHQQQMAQIKGQAAIEDQQRNRGLFETMQNGLDSLSQSILNRTFTWRSAFNNVLSSLSAGFSKTISTIATNWIKGLLQMQTQEKAMTLASVHANAMKAGAAAYQAVVGIPVVGPFLAPAAAAVAYAGTMAFASAEGGYDIPAGVNPMTQLHEREMVLPQEQADAVRDMAAGGRQGGGLVLNGHPLPGGFFMAHQDEFVRFFEKLKRNRYI